MAVNSSVHSLPECARMLSTVESAAPAPQPGWVIRCSVMSYTLPFTAIHASSTYLCWATSFRLYVRPANLSWRRVSFGHDAASGRLCSQGGMCEVVWRGVAADAIVIDDVAADTDASGVTFAMAPGSTHAAGSGSTGYGVWSIRWAESVRSSVDRWSSVLPLVPASDG